MSNVVLNILSEFKGKGAFKEADSALSRLNKGVTKLGRNLGIAFGTAAVVSFGKAAAKAFIDDQKSADRLAHAVKNLGLEFSNPSIASYIEKLSLATGVTDDQLRPAMQALIQTTGSVTESQKLLAQAIDVSAGSGVDLATVAQDLANAYVGKTKALSKYNLGLTQAELKTAGFAKITEKLNEQFKGANAAYLQTYAGKMEALSTAAGEAQEKIGGALIDSLLTLSGSSGVDDLIHKMDVLTDKVVGFIDRFTEGLNTIKAIINSNMFNITANIQKAQVEAYNTRLKRDYMKAWDGVDIPKTAQQIAAEKKADDAAKKRAKAIADAQNKNTAALKKQTALKKAGTVFDMEQIQIIAALKRGVSEDEKRRLELQLAILNDNEVLATKLSEDLLKAQDSTGKLYQYFLSIGDTKIKNPFAFLDDWIKDFQTKLAALSIPNLSKPSSYQGVGMDPAIAALGVAEGYGAFVPQTGTPSTIASSDVLNGLYGMQSTAGFVDTSSVTGTNVKVYVSGSVVTEQELINAIQAGLQSNSLSGAPSQIGRIAGMFG